MLACIVSVVFPLLCLTACDDGGFSPNAAGGYIPYLGATPGGVQDIELARALIEAGNVPPPEAFLVEGMFSEHDLPLEGEAGSDLLSLRAALGVAPDRTGRMAAWAQIGLGSTLDPTTFVRTSQTLVLCIDVSGSMGWDYSDHGDEYGTPGNVVRQYLAELLDRLDGNDRVAIVTFATRAELKLGVVNALDPRVATTLAELCDEGSTFMEAGVTLALSQAREALDGVTEDVRILLITDAQPNVGATEPTEFEELANDASGDGIGLTVIGVGIGLRHELVNVMSGLRGGNAFSIQTRTEASEFYADHWPWCLCPIAYDLALDLQPSAGLSRGAAYGFPAQGTGDEIELDVATVFLSVKRGALLVRLDAEEPEDLSSFAVNGTLGYRTPAGEHVSREVIIGRDGGDPDVCWFEQPAVGRCVALAVLVEAMRAAAEVYGEHPGEAVAIMTSAAVRIRDAAVSLDAPDLLVEADLADALLALMEAGAPQGDLYGP